jgi:hypothetical protein
VGWERLAGTVWLRGQGPLSSGGQAGGRRTGAGPRLGGRGGAGRRAPGSLRCLDWRAPDDDPQRSK